MTSVTNKIRHRESNMELLRIIAMMLVLGVHFCGAALSLPDHKGNPELLSEGDWWKLVVESVTIIGVDLFVLISGYFGIKTSWSGIWKFSLQVVFYSVGIYFVGLLLGIWTMNWATILHSMMIYTKTYYWFVPAYFGLMLIAPLLNAAIGAMSRRTYTLLLIALMVATFYGGWVCDMKFSNDGYSTVNFVLLYLIARYIRLYFPRHCSTERSLRCLYVIAFVLLLSGIFATSVFTSIAFAYNSPFVVGASVALLLFFSTLRFQSRVVNMTAASAFSVYLIHMHPLLWIRLKNLIISAAAEMDYAMFGVWCIVLMTAIFLACVLIDQVRIYLLRPLTDVLSLLCEKATDRLCRLLRL